jgi:hypothetical protein
MSQDDQHIKKATDPSIDPFELDANEGLKEFTQEQEISMAIEALNKDLAKRIKTKKARRKKLLTVETPGLYAAIGILLALIILSFLVIMKMKGQ